MTKLLLLLGVLLSLADSPTRYSEGQVWAYPTRPQDNGSLVKIQKIETAEVGTIYDIADAVAEMIPPPEQSEPVS